MDDLSDYAFNTFRKKAQRSKRIPDEDLNSSNKGLLESLNLTENCRFNEYEQKKHCQAHF
ncbi:MAG: hypothetical protein U9Q98_00030 [Bacteroidota bacterium]|nr:hypothetical protein [Bacteroidota bacterium]